MDKFIEAIVKADHAASARVDAAKKQRMELRNQTEANRDEVYKRLMDEEKQEIQKQQQIVDEKVNAQRYENQKRYEASLISLQKIYDENREQWVKSIVEACLHV